MGGVCVDALNPAGAPSPYELFASGADGGRLVAFDDGTFYSYFDALARTGAVTALVFARETFGDGDRTAIAREIAHRCPATYYVLGNESDAYLLPEPSPSSWSQTPEEFTAFWYEVGWAIHMVRPDAKLIVGGLVSGNQDWINEVLPWLDPEPYGLDVHPYAKDADAARELLLASPATVVLLVLEWWRPLEEMTEFAAMLASLVEWSCWFCWSDGQVPGYGLVNLAGEPNIEYLMFKYAMEEPMAGRTLEQAEQREDWPLGPRWPSPDEPIIEWGNGQRVGLYTFGLGFQFRQSNGEPDVWPQMGANRESFVAIAEKHGFRPGSG